VLGSHVHCALLRRSEGLSRLTRWRSLVQFQRRPPPSRTVPRHFLASQGVILHLNSSRAVVTLLAVQDYAKPTGKRSSPPRNGMFVVCDVSVRVTSGSWHVSPLSFRYSAPGGGIYTSLDGNGKHARAAPGPAVGRGPATG